MKLPKGWKLGRISDFGAVVTGSTPSTADAANFHGEVPFVTPGDIGAPATIVSTERTLTTTGAEKCRRVPAGSTLVVCIGATIGKVGLAGREMVTNQQINAVVPNGNACGGFVFQEIGRIGRELRRLAGTQAIPILSKTEFSDFPVVIPPLPEQRKIAEILGAWDNGLETLAALIAVKERRKKGLMQRLLTGRRRVRGFKANWATCKLGQLFRERVEQNRADLPLLAITADRGVMPRDELSKRDTSSEDKSKYLRIAPGDIGYNTMRMWQGVSALSALDGIISPAYTVCVPTEKIDGSFAAHFFKLPHTIHLFHRHSQGLVDDTLNLKYPNFATIEVNVPSDVAEQRAIADILDACDTELRLLRDQRAAIEKQKRGLMQRLLTGKVRVSRQEGGLHA